MTTDSQLLCLQEFCSVPFVPVSGFPSLLKQVSYLPAVPGDSLSFIGKRLVGSPKGTQLAQVNPEPCLHVPGALVSPTSSRCSVGDAWKPAAPNIPTQAEGTAACAGEVTRVWNLQGGPQIASWQTHDFSSGQSSPGLPQAASWLQKRPVLFPRPDSSGSIHLGAGQDWFSEVT